jgi:2'-5' RNA ligase
MNAIRSFIAIELSAAIQQKLDETIRCFKGPRTSAVRWTSAHNIHLTLKFLGDVSPTNIGLVSKMLKALVSQEPVFSLSVSGLRVFPSAHHPRVLWVGVTAPAELFSLVRLVETETSRLGYAREERPFSPHLTLGRVSLNATPDQVRQIGDTLAAQSVGELGTTEVHEVILFRSDLRPNGAEYTPLLKIPLRRDVRGAV